MMQFVAVLVLVNCILCQEISQFVKEENVTNWDSQKCENSSAWTWVEYKNIGISALYPSLSSLRANEESCTSVPIFLKPESTLHFVVYVKTVDMNSGIVILVTLEDNGLIARLVYNSATDNFQEGWKEISLQINQSGLGYIDLLGYSRDNEMVLIDSIRYKRNNVNIDSSTDKGIITIDEKHVKHNVDNHSNKNELNSDIIEEINGYSRLEDTQLRDTNSNALGSWAIILISLGCVTVSALVGVCAYYIGKFRVTPKVIPVVYDIEPPKVHILPRVRGTIEPYKYNFEQA